MWGLCVNNMKGIKTMIIGLVWMIGGVFFHVDGFVYGEIVYLVLGAVFSLGGLLMEN